MNIIAYWSNYIQLYLFFITEIISILHVFINSIWSTVLFTSFSSSRTVCLVNGNQTKFIKELFIFFLNFTLLLSWWFSQQWNHTIFYFNLSFWQEEDRCYIATRPYGIQVIRYTLETWTLLTMMSELHDVPCTPKSVKNRPLWPAGMNPAGHNPRPYPLFPKKHLFP